MPCQVFNISLHVMMSSDDMIILYMLIMMLFCNFIAFWGVFFTGVSLHLYWIVA